MNTTRAACLTKSAMHLGAALAVLLLAGCAGTGVTSRSVEAVALGLADAELYHRSKVEGDKAMRANLRDAWSELAAVEGELALERAKVGDSVSLAAARKALDEMHTALVSAGAKLEQIAEQQGAAEAHYQGLRATLRATVGLVRALADRDAAEQEANEQGVAATAAVGSALRQAAEAAATGGVR